MLKTIIEYEILDEEYNKINNNNLIKYKQYIINYFTDIKKNI
jgi:hypothetical protein